MPLTRPPVTAADATFSTTGAAAWNAGMTVAGATSGGIPYFSSTTSEATSALLAQYGLVIGGGAGAAPYTDPNITFNPTGSLLTLGTDAVLSRYAAKKLMISGDGTGATTNAGWILGYYGTSGQSGIWSSTVTPTTSNYTLFGDGSISILNGNTLSFRISNVEKFGVASTPGQGVVVTAGTATTDVAALSVTRTNNNAAVATGVQFAFTDTTSAAGFEALGVYGGANANTKLLTVGKAGVLTVGSNVVPSANGGGSLGSAAAGFSALYLDYTNTATVGAVTINKPSGRVIMGAGGSTFTLTNSLITAASHIFLSADSAPGNIVAVQFYAVPAAGSCTINAVPAVTNQTNIDFLIVNAD